jgi:hypothetical protein
MEYYKAKLEINGLMHLLDSDNSGQETHKQVFTYTDLAIGFVFLKQWD